jgi:hypothetical protein
MLQFSKENRLIFSFKSFGRISIGIFDDIGKYFLNDSINL